MKCFALIVLVGFCGSLCASEELTPDLPDHMRRPIQYSKTILLAKEFFGQEQIERVDWPKWVEKKRLSFETDYSLETEIIPAGLLLKFTVAGPAHLVAAFFRYNLSTLALVVHNMGTKDQWQAYQPIAQNLRIEVEGDISKLALDGADDSLVRENCERELALAK